MKPAHWPLTARLTALYTLVAALVMAGLGALVSVAVDRHFVELDRDYLTDKIRLVQQMAGEAASAPVLNERLQGLLASHQGLFMELRDGERTVFGAGAAVFDQAPSLPGPDHNPVDWSVGGRMLRGQAASILVPAGPVGGGALQLRIALDTVHHSHFMAALHRSLAFYLLAALLVSGLLGWWAARRGLQPLRLMKERASAVTAQNLDQRMPVEAVPVEFADLAASLNAMLARLQGDVQRLQAFSSDLAHELRTPLNNLLTQTQVSLAQPRSAREYQDILASNAEEFQRLARMVSDMLFLAKTEHGLELPQPERVDLREAVLSLFDFYDAVAEERQVRLTLDGRATVTGDRLMLRRAISNLLSNALRHAPAGSAVVVTLSAAGDGTAQLCVLNSGPVIEAVLLPRLFDRFFRADPSRQHSQTDGTGLGLSITRAIMTAHGGQVTVRSVPGQTVFCLRFACDLAGAADTSHSADDTGTG